MIDTHIEVALVLMVGMIAVAFAVIVFGAMFTNPNMGFKQR